MRIWRRLASWLPWQGRRQREADLERELRNHLELEAEEQQQAGMSAEEAVFAARRALGNTALIKEDVRAAWGFQWLETLLQDLRYGLRQLRRNPGLTAIAVITLALAIGLNSVIFSVVDTLLFRPLPVNDPAQIYQLAFEGKRGHSGGNVFSYDDLQEIRKQTHDIFSDVAGVQAFSTTGLSVNGVSVPMFTNFVTGNFFGMMGVRPALGRFILRGEGRSPGTSPVVVLGYSFWRAHYGGDRKIIGSSASVNGRPVTIVGVAPRGFQPLSPLIETQGYLPLGMAVVGSGTESNFMSDRKAKSLILIARVRPGISEEKIQATCAVVAKRLAGAYPKADDWRALNAFPLPATGPTSDPRQERLLATLSGLFLALASAVLMVACLNVTNILLARASARRGEIAIRSALGASRGRLVRHLLTESLLLALFGCAGGIGVGLLGIRVLGSLSLHLSVPIVLNFAFDWRVLAYALAIALVAGALAGFAPAARSTGGDLIEALNGGARRMTASRHHLAKRLVIAQVAGSLMLLVIAGLFVRSLLAVEHTNLGFNPRHVLNVTLDPNLAGYNRTQANEFLSNLLERARALPSVQSASLVAMVPMGGYAVGGYIEMAGRAPSKGGQAPIAWYNLVSPGYFETMQIPLLRGRDFNKADTKGSVRVAVINKDMADRFWPGKSPIGQQFGLKREPHHPLQVVGVVADSRTRRLFGREGPYFYMPLAQNPVLPFFGPPTLQVRTSGNPEAMAPAIGELVRSLAPALPLENVQTMTEALDTPNGLFFLKLGAGLAAAMGLLGLLLAMVGLFGVVAYTTAQRTHEIGIRLALGAQPGQILRIVLRQGMFVVVLGCAVGILMALGVAPLAGHLLVGVRPTDPLTFVLVSLILIAVALVACYIPARRAAKVDPTVALRYE